MYLNDYHNFPTLIIFKVISNAKIIEHIMLGLSLSSVDSVFLAMMHNSI